LNQIRASSVLNFEAKVGRGIAIATDVEARIQDVIITDYEISARFENGRMITVPLGRFWWPAEATTDQRAEFDIIGNGSGIPSPEIDEDVSVEGMLHREPARRIDLTRRHGTIVL
jgi:hypothetical protein